MAAVVSFTATGGPSGTPSITGGTTAIYSVPTLASVSAIPSSLDITLQNICSGTMFIALDTPGNIYVFNAKADHAVTVTSVAAVSNGVAVTGANGCWVRFATA